jgi:hypothetical protein
MRIPIKDAKLIANTYGYDIVTIVAWSAKTGKQHVTTFGRSKQHCEWAADLGNQIKKDILKWPKEECCAKPARAKSNPVPSNPYSSYQCQRCGQDRNGYESHYCQVKK